MLEIRVSHDVVALAVAVAAAWLLLRKPSPTPPSAAQRPVAREDVGWKPALAA